MLNFFQKITFPSTFAFFKVKIPETCISEIYLMGIIIAMNVNNKNNPRFILSLANQIDHKQLYQTHKNNYKNNCHRHADQQVQLFEKI